ncbi:uncharacterized protein BP5553_06366 [Venustampulla echinocandica]|uniref:Myb-like domain-containing protein n=1 Tax=Venustampulla echinocandica TaxID=2656787 RepID=A0A370TJQ7_9HELO|nr:uncharacterized protein BP5553_06366 [Venustampulla echinocandica]RDL35754.1 hypothetical protein BP5553_06366 [Venustampulla echinocandica]
MTDRDPSNTPAPGSSTAADNTEATKSPVRGIPEELLSVNASDSKSPPASDPVDDGNGSNTCAAVYDPSGFYARAYEMAANEGVSPAATPEPPARLDARGKGNADLSKIPGLGMMGNSEIRFVGREPRKVGRGDTGALMYQDSLPSAPPRTTPSQPISKGRVVNDYNPFPPEGYSADDMDIDDFSDLGGPSRGRSESRQPGLAEGSYYNPTCYGSSSTAPGSMHFQSRGEPSRSASGFRRTESTEAGPSGQYMAHNPTYGYRGDDDSFYDEGDNYSERSASVYGRPEQVQAQIDKYRIPKYSDRLGASKKGAQKSSFPSKRPRANDDDDDEYDPANLDAINYSESEFGFGSEQYDDDDDDDVFVEQMGPPRGKNKKMSRREEKGKGKAYEPFTTGTYTTLRVPSKASGGKDFINHGENLKPSRYSGATMPWGVNKAPDMVEQKDVSDAALLKRGIKRPRTGKICPRGYGANDPENIEIVNLKENKGIGFARISQILNERRLQTGKSPTLSATGVANRYNRTAPLLFAAEGKQFIPLSQRKRGTMDEAKIQWTSEWDTALVAAVKKYEASKWKTVATLFNEMTGLNADDRSVAIRYSVL